MRMRALNRTRRAILSQLSPLCRCPLVWPSLAAARCGRDARASCRCLLPTSCYRLRLVSCLDTLMCPGAVFVSRDSGSLPDSQLPPVSPWSLRGALLAQPTSAKSTTAGPIQYITWLEQPMQPRAAGPSCGPAAPGHTPVCGPQALLTPAPAPPPRAIAQQ